MSIPEFLVGVILNSPDHPTVEYLMIHSLGLNYVEDSLRVFYLYSLIRFFFCF